MAEEKITTVFLMWDVRYQESGEEKFKIEQEFAWQSLQNFVKDKDVTSITFYANGFTEPVGHISHEKRVYEESLTKHEFLEVNEAWIEDNSLKEATGVEIVTWFLTRNASDRDSVNGHP